MEAGKGASFSRSNCSYNVERLINNNIVVVYANTRYGVNKVT